MCPPRSHPGTDLSEHRGHARPAGCYLRHTHRCLQNMSPEPPGSNSEQTAGVLIRDWKQVHLNPNRKSENKADQEKPDSCNLWRREMSSELRGFRPTCFRAPGGGTSWKLLQSRRLFAQLLVTSDGASISPSLCGSSAVSCRNPVELLILGTLTQHVLYVLLFSLLLSALRLSFNRKCFPVNPQSVHSVALLAFKT